MNKIRKKVLCFVSVILICCILLCYRIFIRMETVEIPWMPVTDIQSSIDVYASLGYCSGGHINEDELGAIIHLTDWQRQKWLKKLYDETGQCIEDANEIKNIRFSVTSDTKEVVLHIDKEVSFETLATYCGLLAWNLEKIQILSAYNDWGFKFVVKDMETEEILYEADFPQDSIRMDASIWDKKDE